MVDRAMESLNAALGDTPVAVRVHPVVLFSIVDHHIHRNPSQPRVIGVLLGHRSSSGIVVKNCFAVPHVESGEEEVAIGKDFIKSMKDLHKGVNPNEDMVGWYATTSGFGDAQGIINKHNVVLQDFFAEQCTSPLHLVVDTSLTNKVLSCRAFVSEPVQLSADKVLAARFQQVKVDLECSEPERIGLDLMVKASTNKRLDKSKQVVDTAGINTEVENLEESMTRLLTMLETCEAYVDDVVNKRVNPDHKIGTKIASVVSMVPRIDPELFARSFRNNMQDLLMVVYLSNMTRTQLAIAERIGKTPS